MDVEDEVELFAGSRRVIGDVVAADHGCRRAGRDDAAPVPDRLAEGGEPSVVREVERRRVRDERLPVWREREVHGRGSRQERRGREAPGLREGPLVDARPAEVSTRERRPRGVHRAGFERGDRDHEPDAALRRTTLVKPACRDLVSAWTPQRG